MFPGVGSKRRKGSRLTVVQLYWRFLALSLQSPSCLSFLDFPHLVHYSPGLRRCICATRMYRSLSTHGSFTEYSYVSCIRTTFNLNSYFSWTTRRSVPPEFSDGNSVPNYPHGETQGINSTIVFTNGTVTQSESTMTDAHVFVPADEVLREFNPGDSTAILTVPEKSKSRDMPGYRLSPRSTRLDVSGRVPE